MLPRLRAGAPWTRLFQRKLIKLARSDGEISQSGINLLITKAPPFPLLPRLIGGAPGFRGSKMPICIIPAFHTPMHNI